MRGRIISWAKSNKDPHSSHSVIIREFGSFVCKTLNIFWRGWGIKFDTSPPFISRECEEIFWSAPSLTALQGLIWRALLAFCRRVRGGWGISFDRRYQVWYLTPLSLVVNLNTVTHFVSNSVTWHCLFADASTIGSRVEPKCCLFVRFVHRHYTLFPKTTMPFSWIIKKLVENNSVSFIFLKETGWK